MIVPERVNQQGNVVPAFQIDEEFAEQVLARKWSVAGGGYIATYVGRRTVLLHRFVWGLKHGSCPEMLDHASGDKRDNRLANLRPATHSLNNRNVRPRNRGSGLPPGVKRLVGSRTRPFGARIRINGRRCHLGVFSTAEEASAAYEAARDERIAIEAKESEAQYEKETAHAR
jgi:hypothetical protein